MTTEQLQTQNSALLAKLYEHERGGWTMLERELMNNIFTGDCVEVMRLLPEKSVQCCVTSPPYYGLRDYGHDGQIGMEKTAQEYVDKMVIVFREVRRLLRDDGTLWLNLGDSYAGSGKESGGTVALSAKRNSNVGANFVAGKKLIKTDSFGLTAKNLIGMPWRVAFALQADGWILRSEIIWAKPNPMPESVTDRPTKAHEQIFLFAKNPKYYFDKKGIEELASYDGRKATMMKGSAKYKNGFAPDGVLTVTAHVRGHERWVKNAEGERIRNGRDVWTINNGCYGGAHFATFPKELPTKCIKAGTSEHGCCEQCGKPYARITEKVFADHSAESKTKYDHKSNAGNLAKLRQAARERGKEYSNKTVTLGFNVDCDCGAQISQCVVLDPFAGSGTTLEVAKKLGRGYIGIELNEQYVNKIIKPRLEAIDTLF